MTKPRKLPIYKPNISTYTIRFQQPGWLPGGGFVEAFVADPAIRVYPVLRGSVEEVQQQMLQYAESWNDGGSEPEIGSIDPTVSRRQWQHFASPIGALANRSRGKWGRAAEVVNLASG